MDNQTFDDVLGAFAEIDKIVKRLKSENAQLEEDKKNLIRADKKKSDHIDELEEENDKLKIHIEAKDKAYMDLLADYNYLKARIKKTERAFLKYEEKQKKLLGDLDMVVMNR